MKYQVIVIGGGPAGYTAAESAGKAGLSVLLIEKDKLGGVCLNEGCIPTKTLLYSAKIYEQTLHALKYAVNVKDVSFDLPKMILRKTRIIRRLVLGVKAKLLSTNHVTIVTGEAQIFDNHTVSCGNETYECDYLILCTGSKTFIPPLPGLDTVNYWTHREALESKELPESLVIVGGGVIGMEFASFFNSLGTQVTVIEMLDEILGGMDKEMAELLRTDYTKKGVVFLTSTKVTALEKIDENTIITYENAQGTGNIAASKLLMSVGRRPVTKGFGLENLNLETGERGRIIINKKMQTSVSNVYVCGDMTGFSLLAHTAIREAEVAINSILNIDDAMSYRAIPNVVYTNPEIAGVGQTEENLKDNNLPYKTIKLPLTFSGRFVAENDGINGMCKLLLDNNDKILGAHLYGNPASEIITLAGIAIEQQITSSTWRKTIFPHPTVSEIFREIL